MSKLRSDELVNMEGDGSPSFPQGAISIEPTADNQVATKSYVDSALSASFGNSVSDTPPANPAPGSFWTDTSVAPRVLKTWDGSSWIEFAGAAPAFTGLTVPPVEVLTPLNGAGLNDGQSFTPISSVITAVGEASVLSKDTDEILSVTLGQTKPVEVYYMTSAPTDLADVLANGVLYVDGQALASSSKIVFVKTGSGTGQVFSGNGSTGFNMYDSAGGGFFAADGTYLAGGGSYNSGEWILFNYDEDAPSTSNIYRVPTHSDVAYTVLNVSGGTGGTLNSGVFTADKILSFPTNTNFSGLSVGDAIQSPYATLDSTQNVNNDTFSNGNLTVATSVTSYGTYTSNVSTPLSGKWYAEVSVASLGNYLQLGLVDINSNFTTSNFPSQHSGVVYYSYDGSRWIDGVQAAYGGTFVGGDIIGIAYDADSGSINFYKNGIDYGTITGVPVREYYFAGGDLDASATGTQTWNFGQNAWVHEPPTGYSGLREQITITGIDDSTSQQEVYATLNPNDTVNTPILSNGNLSQSETQGEYGRARSTLSFDVGDSNGFYAEITATGSSATSTGFAIIPTSQTLGTGNNNGIPGYKGLSGRASGWWIVDGETNGTTSTGVGCSTGDVLGIAVKNGTATFYINGVSVGTLPGLSGEYSFLTSAYGGQNSLTANFGATAFDHTPPSGHVGLSESVTIYPNITVDGGTWDTSDQSQVWSTQATGGSLGPVANAFTGNVPAVGSSASPGNYASPMTFEPTAFSTPGSVNSLVIYGTRNASSPRYIKVDGVIIPCPDTNTFQKLTVDVTSFSSIVCEHNGADGSTIGAIIVNGKLLVDAIDDSETWSNTGSVTGDTLDGYPITSAFDNDFSTYWSAANGAICTYTFASPIIGSKFEFYMGVSLGNTNFRVNGSLPDTVANAGFGPDWKDVSSAVGAGGLSSIQVSYVGGQYSQYIFAIKVDGKILVDTGVRDLGYRKIDSSISYEKSLTFTDTTNFTQLISPLSMTNIIGDTVTPVSDIITNVNGNVLTLASNTNLEYFRPGDEVQAGVQIVSVDESAPSVTIDGGSWLGSDGSGFSYEISKSLRFNSADSSYLSRTPASAGNRQTWTWSAWIKRSKFGSYQRFFATWDGSTQEFIRFESNDTLRIFENAGNLTTTQVFRDTDWFHIVIAVDTTQATDTDRVKLYVDGNQVTDFSSSTYPSRNFQTQFNRNSPHYLGTGTVEYFDGYLADVYFIDGQALLPTAFGLFTNDNIWQAKTYSGGFGQGVTSYHLDFSNSSLSTTLGYDALGNNNWTVGNIGVDFVANSGQPTTWSSLDTWPYASYGTVPAHAFNGSAWTASATADFWYSSGASTVNLSNLASTLGSGVSNITVRVYDRFGTCTLTVNDSVFQESGSNHYAELSIDHDGSPITTLTVSGTDGSYWGISGIKVNGIQLVDGSVISSIGDSFVDTPTDYGNDTGLGGEVRGNYCVINPLGQSPNTPTISDGNLQMTHGSSQATRLGTIGASSGKYYWEIVYTAATAFDGMVGVADQSHGLDRYVGSTSGSWGYYYTGNTIHAASGVSYGSSWTTNDVMSIALDMDNLAIYFAKNGVWQNSGDPTSGSSKTGAAYTNLSGTIFPALNAYGGTQVVNWGARPFVYPAPSGYKSLCTTNLPEPTIKDGSKHFDVVTYAGNSSTNTITGLGFSPDLVWIKRRDGSGHHVLTDSVRGTDKQLFSSSTNAEQTSTSAITSFNSDGFSLGTQIVGTGDTNDGSSTYVAWCWNAGDTTETIAADSLTSSIYNQSRIWSDTATAPGTTTTALFDRITDTSIQATPTLVQASPFGNIVANFTETDNLTGTLQVYFCYSIADPSTSQVTFEITELVNGVAVTRDATSFLPNSSSASLSYDALVLSSEITLLGPLLKLEFAARQSAPPVDRPQVSGIVINGKVLVDAGVSVPTIPSIGADVRANPEAGFSIVSYSSDSSAETVAHGLNTAPELVIIKDRDNAQNWVVITSLLDNPMDYLYLNTTGAAANFNASAPTSTTFKPSQSPDADYIAYCFAPVEGYSAMGSYTGNGSTDGPFVFTGFKPKFVMIKNTSSSSNWSIIDTTRDPSNLADNYLFANRNNAEGSPGYFRDYLSNGFKIRDNGTGVNTNGQKYIYIAFAENPVNTPPEATSGDTQVSLDPLVAAVTEIIETDGTTMYLNGVTGPWRTGLHAAGPTTTFAAPSPNEIEFTSMNQSTTPYTGASATLSSRTWTLESSNTSTGPWTLVDTYVDYDVLSSQDGATPWTSNKPALTPNTFYRVKVAYNATNAEDVESIYHTFKVGNP